MLPLTSSEPTSRQARSRKRTSASCSCTSVPARRGKPTLSSRGMAPLLGTLALTVLLGSLGACCRAEVSPSAEPSASASAHVTKLQLVNASPLGDVPSLVRDELAMLGPGEQLLVYVGATWCEPCQRFHHAAESGELDGKLPPLRILMFDLNRDKERLMAAGYSSMYIPMFALAKPDGSCSGEILQGGVKGDGAVENLVGRLRAFLAHHGAP